MRNINYNIKRIGIKCDIKKEYHCFVCRGTGEPCFIHVITNAKSNSFVATSSIVVLTASANNYFFDNGHT